MLGDGGFERVWERKWRMLVKKVGDVENKWFVHHGLLFLWR